MHFFPTEDVKEVPLGTGEKYPNRSPKTILKTKVLSDNSVILSCKGLKNACQLKLSSNKWQIYDSTKQH